jgi:hypothetical protein
MNDCDQDSSEYTEEEVRAAALDTLNSVAISFPERKRDVDEIIKRFTLR